MGVKRGPTLPGTDRRATITLRAREPGDPTVTIDRAQLAQDILRSLAAGPLMKWQIREALHVNEGVILRVLMDLRQQGQVKVVGRNLDKRAWALRQWQPPLRPQGQTPAVPDASTAIREKKPPPVADSWWTRPLTREQFQERATKGADA